jgi:hypothetical protein
MLWGAPDHDRTRVVSGKRICRSQSDVGQFRGLRVCSFDAIPNRASARIKSRTLTWGSAAEAVIPHRLQVTVGGGARAARSA